MTIRHLSFTDRLLASTQLAVSVIGGRQPASRPTPEPKSSETSNTDSTVGHSKATAQEVRLSGALMRVNHVGEICAQGLYQGQALTARNPSVRAQFHQAAGEEIDHLTWTSQRLSELGARPSIFNPLWYVGSLAIGTLAGVRGDRYSLGFMAETEQQVEKHLAGHLSRLPEADFRSRAIVAQMKHDEATHASTALQMGGIRPPWLIRQAMRSVAKIMTSVSFRL